MSTHQFTDQLGHTLTLTGTPQRIISLVPSQTEWLFALGLDDQIVGLTQFCIHPADKVAGKTKIGGTKQFNFDRIHQLQPDLIIGNKEENYPDGIAQLQAHYPVWMSDIITLDDAYHMMAQLGHIMGKTDQATTLIQQIKANFATLAPLPPLSVAYFIWHNPLMVAGNHTYIHHLLTACGLTNAFAHLDRYPTITPDQLHAHPPDLLLLASEPFHFQEKHRQDFAHHFPHSIPLLVDGEIFSWYGSRMLKIPATIRHLHHQLSHTHPNHLA